jgi:AmmeMemoRadiSam system protein B
MIPFMDYYNHGFKLTPLIVGPMDLKNLEELASLSAGIIHDYLKNKHMVLGRDLFILISADANHYGTDFNNVIFGENTDAHRQATKRDRMIIESSILGDLSKHKVESLCYELWKKPGDDYIVWCGKYSIPFGMQTLYELKGLIKGKKISGSLIAYSDTYTDGVLNLKKPGFGITAPFSLKHWVSYFSVYFTWK